MLRKYQPRGPKRLWRNRVEELSPTASHGAAARLSDAPAELGLEKKGQKKSSAAATAGDIFPPRLCWCQLPPAGSRQLVAGSSVYHNTNAAIKNLP